MKITKYIPSTLTLCNLACGFSAILIGDFYRSSILILIAMLFDVFDGFAARKLNATSELGKELDSLADLVSFGVAPAYLYFLLAPSSSPWFVIPGVILVLGSALRLAKFNILPSQSFFSGLPTPATALFLVGVFLSYQYENDWVIDLLANQIVYWLIPIFFTVMMLSKLTMFSLKGLDKNVTNNVYQIILFVAFIILLLIDNKLALSISVIMFILLSFIQSVRQKG